MKSYITVFALLLISSLSVSSYVVPQMPKEDSDKPLYFATGSEAVVLGTINVKGTIPRSFRLDMAADPVCVGLNPEAQTDSIIVQQGRLQNAFVYLKSDLLEVFRFALPTSEVILERKNCRFWPHVVGMQVNQRLQVVNSDPTAHNTHPTPKLNIEWNQSMAPGSPPLIKTFSRPEVLIPFKCNQHPWEKAYVAVLKHPYFAVSNAQGKFEIPGIPPGTHKLVVWHEVLGEQELELTLIPSETRNTDFTFDADKKH